MKKGKTLRGEIAKLQGAPKQYQQGWTEFYKLKFFLTPDVLIPRPETELLVEEALNCIEYYVSSIKGKPENITVIDIGTGSGNIIVSIAKNAPKGVKFLAVDISKDALRIAEKNALLNGVDKKIIFFQSDLLEYLKSPSPVIHNTNYVILITNLPYIPSARLMLIDPMVADFEPKLALDGGLDGFEIYRTLFKQMRDKNFYPTCLIAEIDEEQGDIAKGESRKYFPKAICEVKKDLAKKDRILVINFS